MRFSLLPDVSSQNAGPQKKKLKARKKKITKKKITQAAAPEVTQAVR